MTNKKPLIQECKKCLSSRRLFGKIKKQEEIGALYAISGYWEISFSPTACKEEEHIWRKRK